jgi:hypothetical protein
VPPLAVQQSDHLGRRQAGGLRGASRHGDPLVVEMGTDAIPQADGGEASARRRTCSARFLWSSSLSELTCKLLNLLTFSVSRHHPSERPLREVDRPGGQEPCGDAAHYVDKQHPTRDLTR